MIVVQGFALKFSVWSLQLSVRLPLLWLLFVLGLRLWKCW